LTERRPAGSRSLFGTLHGHELLAHRVAVSLTSGAAMLALVLAFNLVLIMRHKGGDHVLRHGANVWTVHE
jgi:hypothetical protein